MVAAIKEKKTFRVTQFDLGSEVERVGLYQDVIDDMQYRRKIISKNPKMKYQLSEEERNIRSKNSSISRSRTKVRRLAQRYNMRYLWTLTFKSPQITTVNKIADKKTYYDAGNYDDVWKLWKDFLRKCRRVGLEFNYITTCELQEKRLLERGEKVYHFHFITNKILPHSKVNAIKMGYNPSCSIEELWEHGFVQVSPPKKKSRPYRYIVKYIAKNIEEIGSNKQRYRVNEGLYILREVYYLNDHIEFLKEQEKSKVKVSNYNVLGNTLEIFWVIESKLEWG